MFFLSKKNKKDLQAIATDNVDNDNSASVKNHEKREKGCSDCSGTCEGDCAVGCKVACKDSCYGSCEGWCEGQGKEEWHGGGCCRD